MKKYVFLIVIIMFIGEIKADHYYVNPDGGNDNNSGKSEGSAWQSLAKINVPLDDFKVNDTISFKCGTRIYGQTLIPPSSNLIFNSYGSGARPTIERAAVESDSDFAETCVTISDKNNITFTGLRFTHGWSCQVYTFRCSNITFDSCNIDSTIRGPQSPGGGGGTNALIELGTDNTIKNSTLSYARGVTCPPKTDPIIILGS